MKILIIHTYGIGDWLFFTPVLKAFQKTYPNASIDVILGTPLTQEIVKLYKNLRIKKVVDVRKGWIEIIKILLIVSSPRYDYLIYTAGINPLKMDLLSFIVRAKFKVALVPNNYSPLFLNKVAVFDPSIHLVENNYRIAYLLNLTIKEQDKYPWIKLSLRQKEPVSGSVCIHPGCDPNFTYRRWPLENFIIVTKSLLQSGKVVSVVLGPGELDMKQEFEKLLKYPHYKMTVGVPLIEVCEIIEKHEYFLNSDSGLGHIAAALDRKIICITGPADPKKTRPYSNKAKIILTKRKIECMPCWPDGRRGCPEKTCLTTIEPSKVLKALNN
jgi:ADP-heptose:LPS heptosyltransferase